MSHLDEDESKKSMRNRRNTHVLSPTSFSSKLWKCLHNPLWFAYHHNFEFRIKKERKCAVNTETPTFTQSLVYFIEDTEKNATGIWYNMYVVPCTIKLDKRWDEKYTLQGRPNNSLYKKICQPHEFSFLEVLFFITLCLVILSIMKLQCSFSK